MPNSHCLHASLHIFFLKMHAQLHGLAAVQMQDLCPPVGVCWRVPIRCSLHVAWVHGPSLSLTDFPPPACMLLECNTHIRRAIALPHISSMPCAPIPLHLHLPFASSNFAPTFASPRLHLHCYITLSGHMFCGLCLASWLPQKQSCPTCRKSIAGERAALLTACADSPKRMLLSVMRVPQLFQARLLTLL